MGTSEEDLLMRTRNRFSNETTAIDEDELKIVGMSFTGYQNQCKLKLNTGFVKDAIQKYCIEEKLQKRSNRWEELRNEAKILAYVQKGKNFQENIARFFGCFCKGKLFSIVLDGDGKFSCQEFLTKLPDGQLQPSTVNKMKNKLTLDVQEAMLFLKSLKPSVHHLNLTTKSIFITEDCVAKVTGFEYSILATEYPSVSRLPPNIDHLPIVPNAGKKQKIVVKKWDEFSFGKLLESMNVECNSTGRAGNIKGSPVADFLCRQTEKRLTFEEWRTKYYKWFNDTKMTKEELNSISSFFHSFDSCQESDRFSKLESSSIIETTEAEVVSSSGHKNVLATPFTSPIVNIFPRTPLGREIEVHPSQRNQGINNSVGRDSRSGTNHGARGAFGGNGGDPGNNGGASRECRCCSLRTIFLLSLAVMLGAVTISICSQRLNDFVDSKLLRLEKHITTQTEQISDKLDRLENKILKGEQIDKKGTTLTSRIPVYILNNWTVLQENNNSNALSKKSWKDYKDGVRSLSSYWLGLELCHQLTKNETCRLRVDLWDFDGKTVFAEYSHFWIGSESDNYPLHLGAFNGGTAGDSLSGKHDSNHQPFSTFDKDNDDDETVNCAEWRGGGWWYRACTLSHLNGFTTAYDQVLADKEAASWWTWKKRYGGIRTSRMKFKC